VLTEARVAPLPYTKLQLARVVLWDAKIRSFLECNPKKKLEYPKRVRALHGQPIENLTWDPGEWRWKKIGSLKEASFYSYTSKKGYEYKLVAMGQQLVGVKCLKASNYSNQQFKKVFQLMWHNSRSKKQATII